MKEKIDNFREKYWNFRANQFLEKTEEIRKFLVNFADRISPDTKKTFLKGDELSPAFSKEEKSVNHKYVKYYKSLAKEIQKTDIKLSEEIEISKEKKIELIKKDIFLQATIYENISEYIFRMNLALERLEASVKNQELIKKINSEDLKLLTKETISFLEQSSKQLPENTHIFKKIEKELILYTDYYCKQIDSLKKKEDVVLSEQLKLQILKKNLFITEYTKETIFHFQEKNFYDHMIKLPHFLSVDEINWANENNINLFEETTNLTGEESL